MNKNRWAFIAVVIVSIALCGLAFWSYFFKDGGREKTTKILINQLVEHPALDQTAKGIVDALADAGYVHQKTAQIRIESAQGNAALASQISSKFVNQSPDIVVGIATVSAQSLSKYAIEGKVKLIFSSVTDPLSAKLVKTLDLPSNNTSGVSNFVPLEPQLELFIKLKPGMKNLGFLFNPGELNSVSMIKKLDEISPKFGLSIIKIAANKTADVPQAAIKLAQSCDAIFVSNDNTALSAIASIIKAANEKRIPVFVSDTDAVELGALAALGPNQYQVGRQTGAMMVRVLKGADVNNEPVEYPTTTDFYLNLAAADQVDVIIPDDIVKSATMVFGQRDKK